MKVRTMAGGMLDRKGNIGLVIGPEGSPCRFFAKDTGWRR